MRRIISLRRRKAAPRISRLRATFLISGSSSISSATPDSGCCVSPNALRGTSARSWKARRTRFAKSTCRLDAAALEQVQQVRLGPSPGSPRPRPAAPRCPAPPSRSRAPRSGCPDSSRISESCDIARFSSRSGSLSGDEVRHAPELLRLPHVRVDHERDEAVRVRATSSNGAPSIHSSNVRVRPDLDDGVLAPCRDARQRRRRAPPPLRARERSATPPARAATGRRPPSRRTAPARPARTRGRAPHRRARGSQVTLYAASPSTEQSISLSKSSWSRPFSSYTSRSVASARRARADASASRPPGRRRTRRPFIVYEAVFSMTVFA